MSRQAITHLTQIVDSLPDRLREPWILRYIEELPGHAICARLGIPETTLEQRLREARAFCRAQMARDGFDWSWLD
jgi:RNA polymerase sigma-70 factor (ECF subfamily)